MNGISLWISRIKAADKKDLDQIKKEWSTAGESFGKRDVCKFLREFVDRELELNGVDLSAPAF